MSFFSWLFPSAMPVPDSSGLSRMESTRPVDRRNGSPSDNARPANRKSERIVRRELLYAVVRDAMISSFLNVSF